MKNFNIQRVLIPVDFSDTSLLALEHAVFMARLYKAEITLLHVIESISFTSAISHSATDFEASIERSVTEKLTELASRINRESGVKVIGRTEVGRIYKGIVTVAEEIKADVIVMGTHGVTGVKEFLVGSNAYRVVSEAPCPVISVQSHSSRLGFHDIILPIDDSLHSRQKVSFAQNIASHYGAVVHILGIMSAADEDFEKKFKLKISQVEGYLKKHNIANTVKLVHGGNLGALTLKYAGDVEADLVVIMTEQEEGPSNLLLGPYAQQIVNHSKLPVMSIRPETNPALLEFPHL
jgi:nucleotide-binding universal stress UspA family protein